MKFSKVEPFEKHLEEALPEHPSECYFIFIEDPFERRFLADRVVKQLGLPKVVVDAENLALELEEPSFFSEKRVILCDESKEKSLPQSDEMVLVMMGKSPPPFYKEMEKRGVTVDLRGEKPWDRKGRLQRWLMEEARRRGKTLSSDGAAYLLDRANLPFAQLIQELEKLATFAGEERVITLQMLQAICTLDPTQNGWQLSEAVVWGGPVSFGDTDLYSLVGQLRFQLQLGLDIAEGKEGIKAPTKKLAKIQALNLTSDYYIQGLKELFDLEMKLRSNITDQRLLFDRFRLKLAKARYD